MNVNDIVSYLFSIAPAYMKEEWDSVGLLCGHGDREVTKVLVSLDASSAVLQEAKEKGCQLVVSHHPMIFGGLKQVSDATVTGRNVLFAVENGIACVNMHTNLDCVCDGVNDILAERLGLTDVTIPAPKGKDATGMEYGYVRVGKVKTTTLKKFAESVKEKLSCRGLRYADGGRPVSKVAVGGGACGDEIAAVLAAGCDTFVTADLKYHQFAEAKDMGLNLIDAGHFQTEAPVCDYLYRKLKEQFPTLSFEISKKQDDMIRFL